MTSGNFREIYEHVCKQIKDLEKMSAQEDDDRIKEIVALKVKLYRVEHKLTQSALADQLGVDRMQIIRWESGKHKPSKLVLKVLQEKKIIPNLE